MPRHAAALRANYLTVRQTPWITDTVGGYFDIRKIADASREKHGVRSASVAA